MRLITELQKYKKRKPEGETDKPTVRAGNLSALLMDRTSRQKASKATGDLKVTVKRRDLIYICTTLHPTMEYSLVSRAKPRYTEYQALR